VDGGSSGVGKMNRSKSRFLTRAARAFGMTEYGGLLGLGLLGFVLLGLGLAMARAKDLACAPENSRARSLTRLKDAGFRDDSFLRDTKYYAWTAARVVWGK
jgi:hypothetical protein